MDNMASHKCAVILDNIVCKRLSLYSPILNRFENIFSQWKKLVRNNNPNNQDHLFSRMDSSLEEISTGHCLNYYKHILTILARCINK